MCGRFVKSKDERDQEIRDLVDPSRIFADLRPRYNVAPSQPIPTLRLDNAGQRELVDLSWGFVPSWVKDLSNSPRPINAKAETVASKPYFRSAFRSKRCLIPADGFYEWQKVDGQKQPYLIRRKDEGLFCFGGLWDERGGDEPLASTVILTVPPNSVCEPIHNRMPLIIPAEAYDAWLSPKTRQDDVLALCKPFDAEELEAFPVSKLVNNARNEDPKCVEPFV